MVSTALPHVLPGVIPPAALIAPNYIFDSSSKALFVLEISVASLPSNNGDIQNMMNLTDAASLPIRDEFAHEFIFLNETEAPILLVIRY